MRLHFIQTLSTIKDGTGTTYRAGQEYDLDLTEGQVAELERASIANIVRPTIEMVTIPAPVVMDAKQSKDKAVKRKAPDQYAVNGIEMVKGDN